MRVLNLGDSLGLPRPENIKNYFPTSERLAVSYEETYSSIISREINTLIDDLTPIEVINRSARSSTIKDISKDIFDHLFYFQPDIITMQVGIVDCWYRENINNQQLVTIEEFKVYLNQICELLSYRPNCKLIIIGICPTSEKMNNRYMGIDKDIKYYNQALKDIVNNQNIYYVDMEKFIDSKNPHLYLLPDDIHLNKEGNKLVAEECVKIITHIIKNPKKNLKQNEYPNVITRIQNLKQIKYIFGAGKSGQRLKEYFESNGIQIEGFIDNDKMKIGTKIDNKVVYNLEKFKCFKEKPFFIISSMYWLDIAQQLNTLGYSYKQDYEYHFYFNENFSLII